jgi:hypothetical protein
MKELITTTQRTLARETRSADTILKLFGVKPPLWDALVHDASVMEIK